MATTTNYGWDTPDDTDLVKDGASAIRTLGSSIDTTTKNLNPQTTTGAIAYRSATANVNTALAIGTAGQVLTVNSGATAPEWAAPAAGGMTSIASGSLSGSSLVLSSISGSYNDLRLVIRDFYFDTGAQFRARVNNVTTSVYSNGLIDFDFSNAIYGFNAQFPTSFWRLSSGISVSTTDENNVCIIDLYDYANTSSFKIGQVRSWFKGATDKYAELNNIFIETTSALNRIDIYPASGNFSGGTYVLYGVK